MNFEASVNDLVPHPQNAAIYGTEDVSELAEKIAASNWIKPLVVNAENKRIISGHRRWLAARLLGLARVPVEYRPFDNETDELEALLLENASREKTPEQKVREGQVWASVETEKARQRMTAGINQHSPTPNLAEGSKGETRAKVAQKVGMKPSTYEKAAKVVAAADNLKAEGKPEQAQSLLKTLNEKSVHAAYEAVTHPVKQEEKRQRAQNLPSDVFNVIYADPPWQYDNTGVHGAADPHYDTMPTAEIYALPKEIGLCVDDNAILFLWATNAFLAEGMECIRRWGFNYKSNAVWVKTDLVKPGSGWYLRGRHELLLIATRGSFTPLDEHISPPIGSVIVAPLQEHSRKPEEVYEVIERLYPGCNYVELFARRAREGWTAWGNEVDG